jgi:hypothetical protein
VICEFWVRGTTKKVKDLSSAKRELQGSKEAREPCCIPRARQNATHNTTWAHSLLNQFSRDPVALSLIGTEKFHSKFIVPSLRVQVASSARVFCFDLDPNLDLPLPCTFPPSQPKSPSTCPPVDLDTCSSFVSYNKTYSNTNSNTNSINSYLLPPQHTLIDTRAIAHTQHNGGRRSCRNF